MKSKINEIIARHLNVAVEKIQDDDILTDNLSADLLDQKDIHEHVGRVTA